LRGPCVAIRLYWFFLAGMLSVIQPHNDHKRLNGWQIFRTKKDRSLELTSVAHE
jgi:hypothetical protein